MNLRLVLTALVAASLISPGAFAQLNADQLNKLSLESLTAPPVRPPPRAYAPVRPVYRGYHRPFRPSPAYRRPYRGTRSFLYRPHAYDRPRPYLHPHWHRPAWRPRAHYGRGSGPYYRR